MTRSANGPILGALMTSANETDIDAVIRRMRVPTSERIFVLNCWTGQPLTLFRQQLRAHNLIYAFYKQ
ncbi:hypothetical protein, partial [Myxococcus vastator]|uniref:hypothetical protein n=1 Tax=Myxococcus vastator TaxID=2709664 RepID=UPI001966D183